MNIHVGNTITLDEIEVYVLAAKGEDSTWNSDAGAEGIEYIGVDKNHDLSYYLEGDDFVDVSIRADTGLGEGKPKYAYEWGGYDVETGIQNTACGTGLTNTNALIALDLEPETADWPVLWDKVKEFRNSHSDKWFIPSKDELNLIYKNRLSLSNLSMNRSPTYWSSSDSAWDRAWSQTFRSGINSGKQDGLYKSAHNGRVRLCRYITSSDFYEKKTWVNDELITSTEFNRIENRIKELHSTYEPHEWVNDEVITAEKLNNIETQLGTDKTWLENELITDVKLNNIEDQLV